MERESCYLVSADTARRCGVATTRYVIADGRQVLSFHDLTRLQLTADEYVNGIGSQRVSAERARELIAAGGHKLGSGEVVNINEETEADNE